MHHRDDPSKIEPPRDRLAALSPARAALLQRRLASAGPPPIPRAAADARGALSHSQELLWLLDRLSPGLAVYNVPRARRLRGPLDVGALRAAVRGLVARHEVLRTTYPAIDGVPRQHLDEDGRTDLVELDLRGADAAAVRELLERESARPFDLACDPMLRAMLATIDDHDHVLLLVSHHIASDGWSRGVLFRDLESLYRQHLAGQPAPALPPLPVGYADYAAWQRERLQGDTLAGLLDYWRRQLADAPALIALPTDHPRPPAQRYRGGHRGIVLPAARVARAEQLGRTRGCSLFMTMLAAFDVLLARHAGQRDLVVGTPVANRAHPDVADLIGFFVNTLVLRCRIDGSATFVDLLDQVRRTCLDAYAHQDMPLELLTRALHPQRQLSHAALFQVMFALQDGRGDRDLELPGLRVEPIQVEKETSKFDLTLSLTPLPDGGISVRAEFDADLFEPATVEAMLARYDRIVAEVAEHPEAPVLHLDMLTPQETRALCPGPAVATTSLPTVTAVIGAVTRTAPHAVAVEQEGRDALTYAELERQSNRLAQRLVAEGVRPGELVGVCLPRTPGLIAALLAVLKAGAAYVPLDPHQPADRLAFIARDANLRVVLADGPLPAGLAPLVTVVCDGAGPDAPVDRAADADAAYVIYTSGSQGRPRGVVVGHPALSHFTRAAAARYGFTADDRVLQFASPAFDASVEEIFCTLTQGATLVLRTDEAAGSARGFARCCTRWGVTVADLPTAFWYELARDGIDLPPALRLVILGGERLRREPLAAWRARFPVRPRLVNSYGPTEATVVCTTWDCEGFHEGLHEVPIGRPLDGLEAHVLSDELELQPVGVDGELCVAGPTLARGYLGRDDETARRFVAWRGRRIYRTGDRVRRMADGTLVYCGRLDDQVKIRGFRVEPGEVEETLATCEAVTEAAVLARDDGQGAFLVAFVASGAAPAALRDFVEARLPAYMVPAVWVVKEALPHTAGGKIDRSALRAHPLDGARAPDRPGAPPRTPLEEAVCLIWAEVLHPGAEVGLDDDFFGSGGHSLLAMRLLSRLERLLGVALPLRAVFERPTPRGLAALVAAGDAEDAPPRLTPLATADDVPATSAQQRLWFLEQLPATRGLYHIVVALRIEGALDHAALAAALDGLVARHEALRTTFAWDGERLLQRVSAPGAVRLEVETVLEPPHCPRARELEALRRAAVEAARPFDLSTDLLLRARLYAVAARHHVLVLAVHHVAADGDSMAILWRELAALHDGRPLALPALQYGDYAAWQHAHLSPPRLQALGDWWAARLAGAPPRMEVPTDRPRPRTPTGEGGRASCRLTPAVTGAVRALGGTLYLGLLAAFQALLARLAGTTDVVVGSPCSRRTPLEAEGIVGLFVNTLVLRTDCGGDPTFRELVERVRETVLTAHAHRDMPFEKLVERLQPDRDGGQPLFNVAFTHNPPGQRPALRGLGVERLDVGATRARFDLLLTATEEEAGGVRLSLEYSRDLWDDDPLLARLRTLLEAVADRPQARLHELPAMSDAERATLAQWSGRTTDYPREATIPALFAEQVAARPQATAVESGEGSLTYLALAERAHALAGELVARGVAPGDRVGLCLPRSLDMIAATLAVLEAGAAYVPLDPTAPPGRLAFMLEDTAATLVVTSAELRDRLPEALPALVPTAGRAPDPPGLRGRADDLAYVMYTSGSTGRPKGVAVPHRAVVRLVKGTDYIALDPREVFLQMAPTSFDAATLEIWGPLLNGGRLVLMPPGAASLDDIAAAVARHGVTTMWLTAGLFHEMVDARLDGLRPLRQLLAGGDVLNPSHVRRARAALPHCRIVNGYGPTEGTTFTCCYTVGAEVPEPVPIGTPIPNSRVWILDERRQPVPIGVVGELHAGGDGLAHGYWARPALTAERFVDDPERGRLYRTGDMARWRRDGTIEFVGRTDDQVKIRGFRVETAEIERLLCDGGVARQACVVADRERQALVAYVVGALADGAGVQNWLRERLPSYMVPTAVVGVDALPMTPNGKVDRAALPAPPATPRGPLEPPRDDLEVALVRTWEEVLGVSPIGLDDSFFALGGHSLLAIRLVAALEQRVGQPVPLHSLFVAENVRTLAHHLRGGTLHDFRSLIVPLHRAEGTCPIFWVHSLGGEGGGAFTYYRKLVTLLGPQASYGIMAPDPPLTRIEDMAARYIAEMREVAPHGPYRLGGFCFGGVVAYEMARQLVAAGLEVDRVVLLESTPPNQRPGAAQGTVGDLLRRTLRSLREARLGEGLLSWTRRKVRAAARHLGHGPREVPLGDVVDESRYPAGFLEAARAHWRAYSRYQPPPSSVPLLLVRRAEPNPLPSADPTYRWANLVGDAVTVVEAPGTHESMLTDPHVRELAQRIRPFLAPMPAAEEVVG